MYFDHITKIYLTDNYANETTPLFFLFEAMTVPIFNFMPSTETGTRLINKYQCYFLLNL